MSAMAQESYMSNGGPNHTSHRVQAVTPMRQSTNPFDLDTSNSRNGNVDTTAALIIRKLPQQTTAESLKTMLLFAQDFVGAEILSSDWTRDQGFLTAMARFRTSSAAEEVRNLLHGKQNNPNEPPLFVELVRHSPDSGYATRRNNSEMSFNRASPGSSNSSSGGPIRQPLRYNGNYHNISPTNGVPGYTNGGHFSPSDATDLVSPIANFLAPQSPVGPPMGDRQRVSGQALIREDGVEDEPGELLNDPFAFLARSDSTNQLSRQPTNPQLPLKGFSNLSLNTNNGSSPHIAGYGLAGTTAPLQSPTSAMSPVSTGSLGPNASYHMGRQHNQGMQFPAVNPADQNPPCNTLYVGNLPLETAEDELKALFSKQRGYKRLCFRTKQNGPMCFVEFEDIGAATRTLHELYGYMLHNSVKGGIRLSFSKNPLGVRNGQPGSNGPPTPHSPSGPMPGMNGLGLAPFSTANGPPPGLTAPPGLNSPQVSMNAMPGLNPPPSSMNGMMGFSSTTPPLNGMMTAANMNGMMTPVSNHGGFGMHTGVGMGRNRRSPQANVMPVGWGIPLGQHSGSMYGR